MLKKLLILAICFPALLCAQPFTAGKEYQELNAPANNKTGKAEVLEFFSYGCPWCYRIEPGLEKWVAQHQNEIEFTRSPVVFNKGWSVYAKAYYTASLLGIEKKMTPLLFKAIQTDKKRLDTPAAMVDFFVAQGADNDTVQSAFANSPTIDLEIDKGTALMSRMHIQGVPAIVVNGRCKTDLQMAGGESQLFEVLDFLIKNCRG